MIYTSRLLLGHSRKALPVLMGASLAEGHHYHYHHRQTFKTWSRMEGKEKSSPKDSKKKEQGNGEGEVFTKQWDKEFWKSSIFTEQVEKKREHTPDDEEPVHSKETIPLESMAMGKIKKFLGLGNNNNINQENSTGTSKTTTTRGTPDNKDDQDSVGSFQEMAASFATLIAGGGTEESVQRIVKQARESAEEGDVADKKSLQEMLTLLKEYADNLERTADKFLGDVDLSKLYPTNLFYYVEHEDSIKNPSWKRRMHRFYPGIDIGHMDELNDYLQLAKLSYSDTVEQIQEGLETNKTPYEVVYVDTNSTPNRPAHFIAVKRAQAIFSPYLEILLCVRGTKTIEDAMADILCDYEPYRTGKAHSGVLGGGKVLAQEHKRLLLRLLKSSGKHKIKLTCVGHSLGAGCASIIGMELNDDPNFEVEVIGFGCPALLSKELSEQTKTYITTVVADDDCVPRLSAASVVNALLDIMEYDYLPSARRDIDHAFAELQRLFPAIVSKALSDKIIEFLNPLLDQYLGEAIKEPTTKRMQPTLFPPGNVVHFYRDGVGVTGSVVPCDFFDELIISRRMVDDHLFFSGYEQIFLELMRQHHQDHFFTFEEAQKQKQKKKEISQ